MHVNNFTGLCLLLLVMDISEAAAGINTKPSFELDFSDHGQIVAVVFSPYEYSQEVILIQFSNKVIVGVVSFQVSTSFSFIRLCVFNGCGCFRKRLILKQCSILNMLKEVVALLYHRKHAYEIYHLHSRFVLQLLILSCDCLKVTWKAVHVK